MIISSKKILILIYEKFILPWLWVIWNLYSGIKNKKLQDKKEEKIIEELILIRKELEKLNINFLNAVSQQEPKYDHI